MVVCQSEFVNAPPIRVGEMLGVLLLLGGDFPECLAPGSGEFDKFYKTNFQIPHYAPRWGGGDIDYCIRHMLKPVLHVNRRVV